MWPECWLFIGSKPRKTVLKSHVTCDFQPIRSQLLGHVTVLLLYKLTIPCVKKTWYCKHFVHFQMPALQNARRFIEICSFINLHFNRNFDNEQAQISKARKSKKVALFKFQAVLVKVWPNSCQLSQFTKFRKQKSISTHNIHLLILHLHVRQSTVFD